MGTWAQIRDGMKTRLDTIGAPLVVFDTMPATVADKDVAIILYGDPLVVPTGHGGLASVGIRVIVRVTRGNIRDAQDAIDPYLWPSGAKSIVVAVLGDRTLGGNVSETQWVATGGAGANDGPDFKWLQADVSFRSVVTA